jgi:hypothetical protein
MCNSLSEILVLENLHKKLARFFDHGWSSYGVDNNTAIRFFTNTVKIVTTLEDKTWTWVVKYI